MDVKILDSWLRDYLDTKAKPAKIAEYLSLCGPSVERVEPARLASESVAGRKFEKDFVYDIEVTTNRVDSASIYGIAREASAILPRFGMKANLKPIKSESNKFAFVPKVSYLNAEVDKKLCERFTAVLIKNVKIDDSPYWVRERLESAGIRTINNVVDISNYIMVALGQPVHTFDYDKIKGHKMILRESRKGEKIKTLDGKEFKLEGADIVIEDGEGRLIDLAGVMGGDLSAVSASTKNVLLFVQTYNPVNIRRTSMGLAQRTQAATIFEKGTDPELVSPAILMGIELFQKLCDGIAEREILNIYEKPYKTKLINVDYDFIVKRLGIEISKKDISIYLNALEFETSWKGNNLNVSIPSFRAKDMNSPEDVLEEIARIYGYHNLPAKIMSGEIPGRISNPQFKFENNLKNTLSDLGGIELYTLSLTNDKNGLKLKNPLGEDSQYLRTSLMPSLTSAAGQNIGTMPNFHIFEMANIYLPRKNDLPEERLILAGVFSGYKYRSAKGIIEALLTKIGIKPDFEVIENQGFSAGMSMRVNKIGKFGILENTDLIYYEFPVVDLFKLASLGATYHEIPKYPAQIEDLTFTFPPKILIGDVLKNVPNASLKDIYKDSYTFTVKFQSPNKTLTNLEVEKLRNEIISKVKNKFGGIIKD